jgi:hypothetical protein
MDDFDRLIRRLEKMNATAEIGAVDEKAAEKLAYAEYGTRTAPARPVLSETYDKSEGAIKRAIDNHLKKVIDGKQETGVQLLESVGEDLLEVVREEMQAGFGKSLKPSTIKGRRHRGNMDTTQLIDPSLLENGEVPLVDALKVVVTTGKAKD